MSIITFCEIWINELLNLNQQRKILEDSLNLLIHNQKHKLGERMTEIGKRKIC